MPITLSLSITILLLILSHVALVSGYGTTYEFGEDCSDLSKDVYENSEKYVEYHGKKVSLSCDFFKFRGEGDDILDEYSVCVTPLYFNDTDCAVEIDINTSYSGVTKHRITCTENKRAKYCGPQDESLYIKFKTRFGRDSNEANFKLKITSKKEYDFLDTDDSVDYSALVGAIVGGVISGLVLITVCIALICWCVCKRKQSPGRVVNATQGYMVTVNPYVAHAAQTQQNTMATPSSISSPGVYPMTAYLQAGRLANQQTHGNSFSDAPPNYAAVTESSSSHVCDTIQESSIPPTYDEVVHK